MGREPISIRVRACLSVLISPQVPAVPAGCAFHRVFLRFLRRRRAAIPFHSAERISSELLWSTAARGSFAHVGGALSRRMNAVI